MQQQLVFEGTKKGVRWRETALPVLASSTDALVRPIIVARCDFDVPYLFDQLHLMLRTGLRAGMVDLSVRDYFGPAPFAPPFAVGHEFIAEVVACGADVTGFSPGDRVIVPFQVSCGSCAPCRRARSGGCAGVPVGSVFGFGEGGGQFGGALCDLLRVPFAQQMLVKVPAGISPVALASAGDNLTIAFNGVVPALRERPDARILVLGGGCASIALYAVGWASAVGGGNIDYVDIDHDRRANARLRTAERLGARTVSTLDMFSPVERYDLCIDASSSGRALDRGLRALAPGGVCCCLGLHFGVAVPLPIFPMYMNGVTLRTGWGNPRDDLGAMLETLAEIRFDTGIVETLRVGWDDAERAWMEPGTKVVVIRPELGDESHVWTS